jgi:hypothetical protein
MFGLGENEMLEGIRSSRRGMVPHTGCSVLVRSAGNATGAGSRGICIWEEVEAGILKFWCQNYVNSDWDVGGCGRGARRRLKKKGKNQA